MLFTHNNITQLVLESIDAAASAFFVVVVLSIIVDITDNSSLVGRYL